MPKTIKYTECFECGARLDIDDSAIEFQGDIFCDRDCLDSHVEWQVCEIEIEDHNCDCEEADEDYRDDEDE